jgi:hypothetical protein
LPIPIGLHSPEYSLRDLGLRRGVCSILTN